MLTFDSTWHELGESLRVLPDKPGENTRNTVAALWQLALGRPMSAEAAATCDCPALTAAQQALFAGYLARRLGGEPLAYITGRQRFMNLEMIAEPAALIPRQETELLGRTVIDLATAMAPTARTLLAIDVCTGAGNLAVCLAHSLKCVRVYAADLSSAAVELARRNAALHGLTSRIDLRCGDLLEPFDSAGLYNRIDLMTCNPPYISTGKLQSLPEEIAAFEPRMAFDGGPLSVRIVQRLLRDAPRFLKAGAFLAFEIGLGQGRAVRQRIDRMTEYDDVREVADSHGAVRVLVARRSKSG